MIISFFLQCLQLMRIQIIYAFQIRDAGHNTFGNASGYLLVVDGARRQKCAKSCLLNASLKLLSQPRTWQANIQWLYSKQLPTNRRIRCMQFLQVEELLLIMWTTDILSQKMTTLVLVIWWPQVKIPMQTANSSRYSMLGSNWSM